MGKAVKSVGPKNHLTSIIIFFKDHKITLIFTSFASFLSPSSFRKQLNIISPLKRPEHVKIIKISHKSPTPLVF